MGAGARSGQVAAVAVLAAALALASATAAAFAAGGPAATDRATPGRAAAPGRSPAAASAPLRIVVLGDSYSAGNGAGAYVLPDDGCHRSRNAYGPVLARLLVARGRPAATLVVACSGARIAALTAASRDGAGVLQRAQLAQVPGATARVARLVLVTIGGNDLRFSDMVRCLIRLPPAGACAAALADAARSLAGAMARTRAALRAIVARFPAARIVLVGYPLLGSPPCPADPALDARVRDGQHRLERAQARAVAAVARELPGRDLRFISTAGVFRGHGPCALPARRYVHDVVLSPLWESFHPTRAGHAATARLLLGMVPAAA